MGLAVTPYFSRLEKLVEEAAHLTPSQLASDEDFWAKIRADYKLKEDYVNLENGYYCFLPEPTLEHFLAHVREANTRAAITCEPYNGTIKRLRLQNSLPWPIVRWMNW